MLEEGVCLIEYLKVCNPNKLTLKPKNLKYFLSIATIFKIFIQNVEKNKNKPNIAIQNGECLIEYHQDGAYKSLK